MNDKHFYAIYKETHYIIFNDDKKLRDKICSLHKDIKAVTRKELDLMWARLRQLEVEGIEEYEWGYEIICVDTKIRTMITVSEQKTDLYLMRLF